MSGRAASTFPAAYRDLPTNRLLAVFGQAPARVARAIDDLGPAEIGARVISGKWTIQEVVCHLADSETCGALRIRLALAQPGGPLPAYDEKRFAAELAYASFDSEGMRETLDLFARLRSVSKRLLARVPAEAWGRTSRHAEFGDVTLRQLLELYADHGERHLSQILERRLALGRPLAPPLEALLPERLY
ncbi:MAG TPA: DinB family protein [Thermoanaerobaculia bacterium]|jgi:uncharacterized damage-inducible protein DinB